MNYRYSLSVTSQFPFCGIPLRLDTYSACQFACRYCFASARGGNVPPSKIAPAEKGAFERRLERVSQGIIASAVDEFLAERIPIHMGGMSDPFPPMEEDIGVTFAHLRSAKDFGQPIVLSTKGAGVASDRILQVLSGGPFAVQISLNTLDDKLSAAVDAGAPVSSERLNFMRTLCSTGVAVACRIQPVLPGREAEVFELIEACAEVGVRHVAVEHLKLPIERTWAHRNRLSAVLGLDVNALFHRLGATRQGREWILPVSWRLPSVLEYRTHARRHGLSFGAADTDLLHLSDGAVCCSGADLLGLGDGFRFNYLEAIRSARDHGRIEWASIQDKWRPSRSIAMYVNSSSRSQAACTVETEVRAKWSSVSHGATPMSFYGVDIVEPRESDDVEARYVLREDVRKLMAPPVTEIGACSA